MKLILKTICYLAILSCCSCEKSAEASRLNTPEIQKHTKKNRQSGAQKGFFSLMSYNIAGLPWVVSSSDPVENTPHIGPLLNDFDIVLLQEDFWYHELLLPGIHLPHRTMPQDADPSVFDLHDGLNRFSEFSFEHFSRTMWKECYGYLTDSCDCLARKGFTSALMHLDKGVDILVYNVHFDAGESEGDVEARRKQFLQLEKDINANVGDYALVVAGDVNIVVEDQRDIDNYQAFLDRMGLQDTCAKVDSLICKALFDRVLIKASSALDLSLHSFELPRQFVDKTNIGLSDHLPISVVLDWKKVKK